MANEKKKFTDIVKPDQLSVELIWTTISRLIFKGQEPSQVQHDEMRRAFYIGFTECFEIVSHLSEELEEDHASAVLTRLSNECHGFHILEIERLSGGGASGPLH
jgi:hypothetical protein